MSEKNALKATDGGNERKDRLKARIVLAVQERESPGECPSAEELAAFTDGLLDEKERTRILTHLNGCPDCREEWLSVASELDLHAEENRAVPPASRMIAKGQAKTAFSPRDQRVGKVFFDLPKPFAALGLALAAGLILVVWWASHSPQSQMGALIARSYAEMKAGQEGATTQTLRHALPLPWERADPSYGFFPSPPRSEASPAFGAGLWTGREQLSGDKSPRALPEFLRPSSQKETASPASWEKSRYGPYFMIGQWVILLQAACVSDTFPGSSFWKEQQRTLETARNTFSGKEAKEAREAGILAQAFESIAAPIGNLVKDPSDRRACGNLHSELETLDERLAPELEK